MNHVPEFGTKVNDIMTSFEGHVDAHCYYGDGTHRVQVIARGKEGAINSEWIDVRRLDWNPEAPLEDFYGKED
ncbi:MAG: hypothetical protein IPM64_17395 [Phycisphaerales bacterium]|nr:hypothetical protein [Phycisphaerales bacterium]